MIATVTGNVTSIVEDTKNDKPITNLMLAQQGVKQQIAVRLDGHDHELDLFQELTFTGSVMMWSTRSGADFMLMVRD